MTTALPCPHLKTILITGSGLFSEWCENCGAFKFSPHNNWQLPSGRGEDKPPSGKTLSVEEIEKIISDKFEFRMQTEVDYSLPFSQQYRPVFNFRECALAIFNAQKGTE